MFQKSLEKSWMGQKQSCLSFVTFRLVVVSILCPECLAQVIKWLILRTTKVHTWSFIFLLSSDKHNFEPSSYFLKVLEKSKVRLRQAGKDSQNMEGFHCCRMNELERKSLCKVHLGAVRYLGVLTWWISEMLLFHLVVLCWPFWVPSIIPLADYWKYLL